MAMSGPITSAAVKRPQALAPIVPRKTAWAVGGLALLCLIAGAVTMLGSYAARARWNTTDAVIAYSQIISFGGPSKTAYRLQVEFSYTVGQVPYVVPHTMPATYLSRRAADDDALRYRMGSVHQIYYDAALPYRILLDRRSATQFFMVPLLLTAVGALLGGGLLLAYLRSGAYFCPICGMTVKELHAYCFHCGRRLPTRKGKMMA